MEEGRILDAPSGAVNPTAVGERILPGGEGAMSGESDLVRSYPIGRVGRDGEKSGVDRVTVEEPLEIRVGGRTLAVTMRTPGNDFELAAGFLAAEGIVSRREEILRIEHCSDVRSPEEAGNVVVVRTTTPASGAMDRARRLLLTTSSCGLCGKGSIEALHGSFPPVVSDARLDPAVLVGLPDRLRRDQSAFRESGGLHGAGIFSLAGEPEVVREDVGRHNAVDKAIGTLFLAGRLPLPNSVLLVSGRASFEIVQKALAAGLPFVAAVSAPSSLAIDLARESGITLVAFLRKGTFNVYSRGDRLDGPAGAR
jgi:FdhD protein